MIIILNYDYVSCYIIITIYKRQHIETLIHLYTYTYIYPLCHTHTHTQTNPHTYTYTHIFTQIHIHILTDNCITCYICKYPSCMYLYR